jgi:uncharacterized membrane protein YeaQ/YmgE (transglycosylase-associated protein family)
MNLKDKLTPDPDRSEVTTATGASVGAAVGAILAYVLEVTTATDLPAAIEGAVIVVCVYLVARFLPAR